MRRRRGSVGWALVALLATGATCDERAPAPLAPGASGAATAPAGSEDAVAGRPLAAQGWAHLPASPLGPRHGANAFWIDDMLLVVGGRDTPLCPPGADCVRPEEPPLRDGARYDPATQTWIAIAPAPRPVGYARGAVLGSVLHLLIPGFDLGPRARPVFLAYDAAADRWERLPLPRGGDEIDDLQLVAAGDVIVAVRGTQERRVLPDLVYDPTSRTWDSLPLDPLAPSFDRSAVWTGDELVLLGIESVGNPGSVGPSLYRAAALDLGSRRWRRLPDSEVVGSNPAWFWAGQRVVNASVGSADGGDVNNWGRAYPFGGVLDPATGMWSALPALPAADVEGHVGVQVAGDEHVVGPEGWVLHVPTMAWTRLPRPEGAVDEGSAVAWGDGALYVWGGVRRGAANDEIVADGWVWRP